jgi:hypothetical protein
MRVGDFDRYEFVRPSHGRTARRSADHERDRRARHEQGTTEVVTGRGERAAANKENRVDPALLAQHDAGRYR